MIVPLDLAEGARYTKPVCDDSDGEDIDHIYKLTAQEEDWINPTMGG